LLELLAKLGNAFLGQAYGNRLGGYGFSVGLQALAAAAAVYGFV
jgi:hypothetical protein